MPFNLNMTMDEARSLGIVRIYDEIERRLVAVFGGAVPVLQEDGQPVTLPDGTPVVENMVNRGFVHFYLPERKTWPLITIEPFTDAGTAGTASINHEEEIRVRATVMTLQSLPADPDTLMRHLVSTLRRAIFDQAELKQHGGVFLHNPVGKKLLKSALIEKQAAQFILPEPGLPYCSVHLSLQLGHIESTTE